MDSDIHAQYREELACAANLAAHPMGGLAAGVALNFGLGAQLLGFWMGAAAGAVEFGCGLFGRIETGAVPGGASRDERTTALAATGKKR